MQQRVICCAVKSVIHSKPKGTGEPVYSIGHDGRFAEEEFMDTTGLPKHDKRQVILTM